MSNKKWNVVHHSGQCYVTEPAGTGGSDHIIARVDDLAYADLIAAAPRLKAQRDELLAASKRLIAILSECNVDGSMAWSEDVEASYVAAREAVAKAEGAK